MQMQYRWRLAVARHVDRRINTEIAGFPQPKGVLGEHRGRRRATVSDFEAVPCGKRGGDGIVRVEFSIRLKTDGPQIDAGGQEQSQNQSRVSATRDVSGNAASVSAHESASPCGP